MIAIVTLIKKVQLILKREMENANQPAGGVMGVRKETSVDPVKAEGIL